jgi:hypothetical protein
MPNFLCSGFRELFIIVLLTSVSPVSFWSSAPQGRDSLQLIPGTTLRVAPPANWQLDSAAPIGSPQLKYVSKPEYTLMVSQTNSRTTGHSCMDLIGSMEAVQDSVRPSRHGLDISPKCISGSLWKSRKHSSLV